MHIKIVNTLMLMLIMKTACRKTSKRSPIYTLYQTELGCAYLGDTASTAADGSIIAESGWPLLVSLVCTTTQD